MRIEKVVLRVGGTCMFLGAGIGAAGLVTGQSALKLVAKYFLGAGVVVASLPLIAVLVYTGVQALRRGRPE